MSTEPSSIAESNSWRSLQQFTEARIGLGRTGVSLPTHRLLEFQLAHASARDAVSNEPDWEALEAQLAGFDLPMLRLHSQATTREIYLQRPDLGRCLDESSKEKLESWGDKYATGDKTVALVIVDGLSASAIEKQTAPLLQKLIPAWREYGYTCDLICRVSQGRVAVGDEVASLLGADYLVLLVGERPGLSSPDSMGIYYTYGAKIGSTDADRNCISNVREGGLSYAEASHRLLWLMNRSTELKCSGVMLKDESTGQDGLRDCDVGNFLVNGTGFKSI